jgi:hypothetical protein
VAGAGAGELIRAARTTARSGRRVLALVREDVTASRVQAQADRLAPGGPDAGKDAGEAGVLVDVDGVLLPPAAEGDIGYPA